MLADDSNKVEDVPAYILSQYESRLTAQENAKSLFNFLHSSIEKIPCKQYKNDPSYIKIWIAYIGLYEKTGMDVQDKRSLFKYLRNEHVGLHSIELNLEWAKFEAEQGKPEKAKQILEELENSIGKNDIITKNLVKLKVFGSLLDNSKNDPGEKSLASETPRGTALSLRKESFLVVTPAPTPTNSGSMMASSSISSSFKESMNNNGSNDPIHSHQSQFHSTATPSNLTIPPSTITKTIKRIGLGPPKRIGGGDYTKDANLIIPTMNPITHDNSDNSSPKNHSPMVPDPPMLVKESLPTSFPISSSHSNLFAMKQSTDSISSLAVPLASSLPPSTPVPLKGFNSGNGIGDVIGNNNGNDLNINKNDAKNNINDKSDNSSSQEFEEMSLTMISGNPRLNDHQSKDIQSINETPSQSSSSLTFSNPNPSLIDTKRTFNINNRIYNVIGVIGKGGSSKVFKVLSQENHNVFAVKRVSLKNLDQISLNSFLNEIQMLKRFQSSPYIIKLLDYQLVEGHYLWIVMEYGEIDMSQLLRESTNNGQIKNYNQIRWCLDQMILSVQIVHQAKIVHCDLKPANFLLVRGRLKLIDFGIAKAIQNDTTNIVRENQVGTVNYMSPEALLECKQSSSGPARIKIGRPSDIWSIGCILYELAYGRPPFAQFSLVQRLQRIMDPNYEIEYGKELERENPFLLDIIKGCLNRIPKKRYTLEDLSYHPFLKPELSCITKEQIYRVLKNENTKSNQQEHDEEHQYYKKILDRIFDSIKTIHS